MTVADDFGDILTQCDGVCCVELERGSEPNARYSVLFDDGSGPILLKVRRGAGLLELPNITLDDPGDPFVMSGPHIMANGNICYQSSSESQLIDFDDQVGVTAWALTRAAEIVRIAATDSDASANELMDEATSYWVEPVSTTLVSSILWKAEFPATVEVGYLQESPLGWLAINRNATRQPGTVVREALFVRFPDRVRFARVVLRPWREKRANLRSLILDALPADSRKLCKTNETRGPFGLVLVVGTHAEAPVVLGVSCEVTTWTPMLLQRIDDSYLRERGGAKSFGKPVVLVGCGAIGGHVAAELARSGFNDIVLIDDDTLAWDNVYRHTMGIRGWQHPKVHALQAEINARYPNTRIHAHPERADSCFETVVKRWPNAIWLACAGSPTLHLWLTRMLAKYIESDLIIGWIEPFGLGGHVLVSAPARHPGCYDCLFQHPVDGNVASLVVHDRPYSKRMAGCGQTFTPFGSVDAMEVACEMVRAALGVVADQSTEATLTSWRRNSASAAELGVTLSPRLADQADGTRQTVRGIDFHAPGGCPTCGKQ